MLDDGKTFNDIVDTFLAMARVTETESDEVYRKLTQAIRTNIPDKSQDASMDGMTVEPNDEQGALAVAMQAREMASVALSESREPELLPDEFAVLYGKAAATYTSGNSVSIVPCEADGTAFDPVPSAIDVWITFPTDNTQTGYDIAEDDVLAYLPIPDLGGKLGVLLPVAKVWIKTVGDIRINTTSLDLEVKYTKADGTLDDWETVTNWVGTACGGA